MQRKKVSVGIKKVEKNTMLTFNTTRDNLKSTKEDFWSNSVMSSANLNFSASGSSSKGIVRRIAFRLVCLTETLSGEVNVTI